MTIQKKIDDLKQIRQDLQDRSTFDKDYYLQESIGALGTSIEELEKYLEYGC